jgi:hypothetical protein
VQGEPSLNKDQARVPYAPQATFALQNKQLQVSALVAHTARVGQLTARHAQPAISVQKHPLRLSNALQVVTAQLVRHLVHRVHKVTHVLRDLIIH